MITTESLHLPQLLNFIVILFLSFGSITFYLIMITFTKYLKILSELMKFIGRYIQSEDMKTYPYSTQAAVLNTRRIKYNYYCISRNRTNGFITIDD